jgi:hypothetical protein
LGGVVAISGALRPLEDMMSMSAADSPCLVLHGKGDPYITDQMYAASEAALRQGNAHVTVVPFIYHPIGLTNEVL